MAFFDKEQAAAVLKHGLLRRYIWVFANKTGSSSTGKRVVYLDGYAGPGVYADGASGSPMLAAKTSEALDKIRDLHCLYVEKNPDYCDQLRVHLKGINHTWDLFPGTIQDHLGAALDKAGDDPLFAFFDPFGLGISFELLTEWVLKRSKTVGITRLGPITEVLLNFSLPGLHRNAGKQSQPKVLANVDDMLGGDWWRAIWLSGNADREERILTEYVERVRAAGGGAWSYRTFPVGDKWRGAPVYYLVFFTQHADGLWAFNNCMSYAMREFRDFCFKGQQDAFLEEEWVSIIANNIQHRLARGSFTLESEMDHVFEGVEGYAGETHVTQAIKRLESSHLIAVSRGKKVQKHLLMPPTQ